MSKASRRTGSGAADRTERLHSRVAALLVVLWHGLLLLLVMLSPPIDMTPPPGGAAGGALQVVYIDESLEIPSPAPPTPVRKAPPREPRKAAPAATRIQTTPVAQADDPERLQVVELPDSATTSPASETTQPPGEPASAPPHVPDAATRHPPRTWGRPPGMLPQDLAPVNAGIARSRGANRNRRNDAPLSGSSMEVGGYHVYYDLLDEARLRAWRDQGMTELFLPLPGTRRLMVCPLEVALRRDSGECRLVQPDSPELDAIGDARDVVVMQRIDRLGEVLWSGPGAYR